ncbi:uncharacterized protein BJ212DRAFT_1488764 [Suillus subaureus]|uniref:Uncharacterized protein n=1 Tax=Suillus subaureus TaxID=48587 RepID=A0A9P7DLR2_9AGAM|nr:uncharacterized protein BJ212DRAFT_1488764 [Suillus subaureus]KAG1797974.1 hypothetical protein BJ212DRAFT_1488764 [Suillus subaureus]
MNSVPDPLVDTLQALGEEPRHPEQPHGPSETHVMGVQQVIIAAIHATDLTLGLRHIPAGFLVVVKTNGAECQTSNKPVHVDQAVVEWNEPILLHIHRAALLAIKTSALPLAGNTDAGDLGQEQPAAFVLPLLLNQLAKRAKWCLHMDDLHALEEVISLPYNALGYYNAMLRTRIVVTTAAQ